jgi:hypothetical protein
LQDRSQDRLLASYHRRCNVAAHHRNDAEVTLHGVPLDAVEEGDSRRGIRWFSHLDGPDVVAFDWLGRGEGRLQ